MTDPKVFPSRVEPGNETVIVFLHGFLGEPAKTWGRFPELLGAEPSLSGWDVYCVGYETSLFSFLPFWSSDLDIPILAEQLVTVLHHAPFDRYEQVALIGHSMGGLVAQRALVDSEQLQQSVGHLRRAAPPAMRASSSGWTGGSLGSLLAAPGNRSACRPAGYVGLWSGYAPAHQHASHPRRSDEVHHLVRCDRRGVRCDADD